MNKRDFLQWLAAGAAVSLLFVKRDLPQVPELERRGVIRPPGALHEDEFRARCIRCDRCVQVCEVGAVRLHDGMPYIVPEERACNLCLRCGPACPTGALAPLAHMRDARMGTAVVDENRCVSFNGTGICGACFTVCPLRGRAIRQGMYNRPTVTAECVGCGLCEEVCIVDGDRAIRVVSDRSWS